MRIRGKEFYFGDEQINNIYGLPDANMKPYEDKGCKLGRWLTDKLCPDREVLWSTMKIRISLHDFTVDKKRKIDLGKSIDKDTNSCRPSTVRLFEEISIEIRVIKELVSRFPTGIGGSSTTLHSCVAQTNYERFLANQQEQGDTISRIERVYSSLAHSHRELRDSHEKIKKREKKRDKFFTKMWKRVKSLWKVLKPKERLPSPRVGDDDEVPATWSNSDDAKIEIDYSG
ncbi:hypothetical protein FXO37_01933 [Capsicum annuum]|nr:hypothetical protein FXO37_01933 [Capsicum annuum]